MHVAPLVKAALDTMANELPDPPGHQTEQFIQYEMDMLRAHYQHLDDGPTIDYGRPFARFAYVYKYVLSHSEAIYQIVRESSLLANLFRTPDIQVTCLGSGPGSDILGLLKFIDDTPRCTAPRCMLCDREKGWWHWWRCFQSKLTVTYKPPSLRPMNISNPATWQRQERYLDAHLVTLVYVVSEIYGAAARPFFAYLFDHVRPGTLFLYVDNKHSNYYDWFDAMAQQHGIEILKKGADDISIDKRVENIDHLGPYLRTYGYPKLTAKIAYRICQKTEG